MGKTSAPLVAVVDDDRALLESISDLLASAGYATLGFPSAQALLDSGRRTAIDCLVTDVRMPGISGWQLVALLREQQPQLPIIVLTAHEPSEWGISAHSALVASVQQILFKPFDAQSLLGSVHRAVRRSD
jgi:FixJ family two-component response regulator